MFHNISREITDRMQYLESIDTYERVKGLPPSQRLCLIPPETGKLISLLAVGAPEGTFIEIGTSAGYSTLWLVLACRVVGKKIKTYELRDWKVKLAQETFKSAGIESYVELIVGDAREYVNGDENIAFCFLDANKEVYLDCYEKVIPNMVSGGILVADNILSHRTILEPFIDHVMSDVRMDSVIVPIGTGELVCRKL